MVVAVIVSGCQGATSTQNGSGSKDSNKGLSAELFPATEVGMIGTPGAQLSCFWGEDCLGPPEEGNWNPVAIAIAVESLIELIKQAGGSSQCNMDAGREKLRCLEREAQKNGIVTPKTPIPNTPKPPTVTDTYSMKTIVIPNTSTMPGSPVKTQTNLRVYNTGNQPLTMTAETDVVKMGDCPNPEPGSSVKGATVQGIEVSPSTSGPVEIAPGVVFSQPLLIDVEDTVAVGQYQICAIAEGASGSGSAESAGMATLTVANVPLRIDQSDMPTSVVAGTSNIEGKITVTNLSPAQYSGVIVQQQFSPSSNVTVEKATMEDAACVINTPTSSVRCVIPKIDKDDSKDFDITFDSNPIWAGKLTSTVTVTSIGNPSTVSVVTLGNGSSPSAGVLPDGPWIGQSGSVHLTGPTIMTYQDRYLYLAPEGVLQLRDNSSNATVWSANPGSLGGEDVWAQMQLDGNFVIYGEPYPPYNATSLWATATSGNGDRIVATLGTAYTPDGVTAIDSNVNFYIFNVTTGTVLFDSAGTPTPFAAIIR